jgi:hypothetical protein
MMQDLWPKTALYGRSPHFLIKMKWASGASVREQRNEEPFFAIGSHTHRDTDVKWPTSSQPG